MTEGIYGETSVSHCASKQRSPYYHGFAVVALPIGISDRLSQPPGHKSEEPKTDQSNPDAAEWLLQQGGDRCFRFWLSPGYP
ncbi:hypothetical protein D3C73_1214130 [compost metagenome]